MSTLVGFEQSQTGWDTQLAKPLDEAAWQAWTAKGRAEDQRAGAARISGVKWASIAVLLGAAGLWSHLALYEVPARFIVSAGAMVVMLQSVRARHYTLAAVFAALALLYNPVAPVFHFSGDWQRALVMASVVPFVASLVWSNKRLTHNG